MFSERGCFHSWIHRYVFMNDAYNFLRNMLHLQLVFCYCSLLSGTSISSDAPRLELQIISQNLWRVQCIAHFLHSVSMSINAFIPLLCCAVLCCAVLQFRLSSRCRDGWLHASWVGRGSMGSHILQILGMPTIPLDRLQRFEDCNHAYVVALREMCSHRVWVSSVEAFETWDLTHQTHGGFSDLRETSVSLTLGFQFKEYFDGLLDMESRSRVLTGGKSKMGSTRTCLLWTYRRGILASCFTVGLL